MAWNVLILGGGFGGLTAARRLERRLPHQSATVTLVNDANFMLYTPLLPGAAGGPDKLKRLSVQFRGMGLPEVELVVTSTVREVRDGVAVVDTEAKQGDTRVVRRGEAEIAVS
jgi:NADH dehydrogenase FAD-containing subunit